jgi:hypothetical protein
VPIDNSKYNHLFVTEIDDIYNILLEEELVFLYDTVAISHHEKSFYKYNENIVKEYSRHHPILLTETIFNELRIEEDTEGRYEDFLRQFPLVIVLSEEDFPKMLAKIFSSSKHIFAKFRESAVICFQTFVDLSNSFSRKEDINDIMTEYHDFFDGKKNKGEYSLLWLSNILRWINPNLQIHFMGVDRDLYSIVYHCYFRHESFEKLLRRKAAKVEIMSTDSLLFGFAIQKSFSEETLKDLCTKYREENRKLLYKEVKSGIPSHHLLDKKITNDNFVLDSLESRIIVVY